MKKFIFLLAFIVLIINAQSQSWFYGHSFGGSSLDRSWDIALNKQNEVYITGQFSDTLKYQNDTMISKGTSDIMIMKFDATGNVLWAKGFG